MLAQTWSFLRTVVLMTSLIGFPVVAAFGCPDVDALAKTAMRLWQPWKSRAASSRSSLPPWPEVDTTLHVVDRDSVPATARTDSRANRRVATKKHTEVVRFGPVAHQPAKEEMVERDAMLAIDEAGSQPLESVRLPMAPSSRTNSTGRSSVHEPALRPAANHATIERAEPSFSPAAMVEDSWQQDQQRLRELGAVRFKLQRWGSRLFRCSTQVALQHEEGLLRHFEAVEDDPGTAIRRVVAQVEAWKSTHVATHPASARHW